MSHHINELSETDVAQLCRQFGYMHQPTILFADYPISVLAIVIVTALATLFLSLLVTPYLWRLDIVKRRSS